MNPIAVAITTFLHSLRDAEEVVNFYVPVAGRLHNKRIDELKEEAEQAKVEFRNLEDTLTNFDREKFRGHPS